MWQDALFKLPYKTIQRGHFNIIKYFKSYNIMIYSWRSYVVNPCILGGSVEFLIYHISETTFKTASRGYLDGSH